jgi:hypothetical protein
MDSKHEQEYQYQMVVNIVAEMVVDYMKSVHQEEAATIAADVNIEDNPDTKGKGGQNKTIT